MVESIKNLTKNIDVPKTLSNKSASVKGTTDTAISPSKLGVATGIDSVDVSGSLPSATLADFTKSPPINVETVSRIKEAIANGEYPIDLDAVADMLLDAYKEMKS